MVHGVSPLLIEILAGINQQDTPLLLSLRTPEITITHEALVWDVKPDHLLDLNTQTPKQFCCQCACGT